MKTNDLKKDSKILLRNGWKATLLDNKKGNIRMAEVEGFVKEAGSVYAHDIVARYHDVPMSENGSWIHDIEYTDSQLDCQKRVKSIFNI
jgi:hypothetical protein